MFPALLINYCIPKNLSQKPEEIFLSNKSMRIQVISCQIFLVQVLTKKESLFIEQHVLVPLLPSSFKPIKSAKSILLSHLTDENIETQGDQLPVMTELKFEQCSQTKVHAFSILPTILSHKQMSTISVISKCLYLQILSLRDNHFLSKLDVFICLSNQKNFFKKGDKLQIKMCSLNHFDNVRPY